ncbi:MAG TPA: hypothetical protein VH417_14455 [Vicinamibacterales bacterium]|jgi:chemotaxis protein histidine kinase CheA
MFYRTRMLGIAAAAALSVAAPAAAQMSGPTKVRVVAKTAKIMATTAMASDVIEVVPQGTEFDVLLEDDGWYWIVLPRDGYGTRHGGWVRVKDVDGTTEAELAAKAAQAEAKKAAREAQKQAEADKRAAKAEQQAAAKEAAHSAKADKQAAKAEQQAAKQTAKQAQQADKVDAQQTTHANATSGNGADDKRLQKAQKDLEKARADYEAAMKRRSDASTTTAAAPGVPAASTTPAPSPQR